MKQSISTNVRHCHLSIQAIVNWARWSKLTFKLRKVTIVIPIEGNTHFLWHSDNGVSKKKELDVRHFSVYRKFTILLLYKMLFFKIIYRPYRKRL